MWSLKDIVLSVKEVLHLFIPVFSLSSHLKGILNEQGILNGPDPTENARFGMSISVIPDLDLDGFNDVVVGSPLEDRQKGVIYIYNGDKKTLNKDFSQVSRETQILDSTFP